MLKILAYLAGTRDRGLIYRRGSSDGPSAYADSSSASIMEDRKSVSGVVVMYGSTAVRWLSKAQRCVMFSSTEAEYVANRE